MADQAQQLREQVSRIRNSQDTKDSNNNAIKIPEPPKNKQRIIAITSGKGGVGKTTFAVNFAIALAEEGMRVLLIDADFGFANVGTVLGIMSQLDLTALMHNGYSLNDIMTQGPHGIKLIAGGSGLFDLIKAEDAVSGGILNQLYALHEEIDIVLFDTGAGINDGILRIIASCDDVIVVTTPEPTALVDAYSLIKIVSEKRLETPAHLVINKAETEKEANLTGRNLVLTVEKYLGVKIDIIGHVIDDYNVVRAVKMQKPYMISFPTSVASKNVKQISKAFLNIKNDSVKKGIMGFLSSIIKRENRQLL